MLKRWIRPSIISIIQCLLLVIIITCIVPMLLKNTITLNHWREYFQQFKGFFLLTHGLFYVLLYGLWPQLIRWLGSQYEPKPCETQIQHALSVRKYLIGTFILFESLTLLR